MTEENLISHLRIGTRGSPLAMWQALHVRDRLAALYPATSISIEEIKTTGDQILDRPLSEVGGKGLFTKELDRAVLDGRCDIAVHSLKDVETWLAEGIRLAAILEREDVRDAFISPKADSIDALPSGAKVGTSSLRRKAQLLAMRPDLEVVLFRGNVQTRLRKLEEGVADATFLAYAGLKRLEMAHVATSVLPPETLLPAVGQGALAIAIREDDVRTAEMLTSLNDAETAACTSCERAFLEVLDGSCHTPIAGLATVNGSEISFRGLVAREDGKRLLRVDGRGAVSDAIAVGRAAGADLKERMGEHFFDVETGDRTGLEAGK